MTGFATSCGVGYAYRVNSEPDELTSILRRGANAVWGLGLTEVQISQFSRYAELLVEWNANRMNLTRLTSPNDIAVKHFLDSLALFQAVDIPENARLIDVGTGAGLPGFAVKIMRPDVHVTLLDSTAKKLTFCQAVIDDLGLAGIEVVHGRAEDVGRLPAHAGRYDVVTARAVAALEKLLPWCAPFVHRGGGKIVALKGAITVEELAAAWPVAKRLRLELRQPIAVTLPEADEETVRHIVVATA